MEKGNQAPKLPTEVETLQRCLVALDSYLATLKGLKEFPDALLTLRQKYSALAQMLVKGGTYYLEPIMVDFIRIINGVK